MLENQRGDALNGGVLPKESQRLATLSMLVRGEAALADVVDKPIVTLAGGSVASLREVAAAKTLAVARVTMGTRGEKFVGYAGSTECSMQIRKARLARAGSGFL